MLTKFLHEEDGAQVVEYRAQVVEYALIIAMVSIALFLTLQPATIGASFGNFIVLVSSCLTAGCI